MQSLTKDLHSVRVLVHNRAGVMGSLGRRLPLCQSISSVWSKFVTTRDKMFLSYSSDPHCSLMMDQHLHCYHNRLIAVVYCKIVLLRLGASSFVRFWFVTPQYSYSVLISCHTGVVKRWEAASSESYKMLRNTQHEAV